MKHKIIVNLFKSIGQTPLDTTKEFKKQYPAYKNVTLGYAGRLDPMEEGVLLAMVDGIKINSILLGLRLAIIV